MYVPQDGWELHPLNGHTGDAFMGVKADKKIFLKRNSSPFIVSLSALGITPRLMWTQKTYSGDTLVAQEWKNGRLLSKDNMNDLEVIQLIAYIHQSDHLTDLLTRMQGDVYQPLDFIKEFYQDLPQNLASNQTIQELIQYLEDSLHDGFYKIKSCVCHGDLHHQNFLKDETKHLYLVDWENVRIADPISDITYLLIQYYPPSQWMDWFKQYHSTFDYSFYDRVVWYSIINCLKMVKHHYIENRYYKVNEYILLAKNIYRQSQQSNNQPYERNEL